MLIIGTQFITLMVSQVDHWLVIRDEIQQTSS